MRVDSKKEELKGLLGPSKCFQFLAGGWPYKCVHLVKMRHKHYDLIYFSDICYV